MGVETTGTKRSGGAGTSSATAGTSATKSGQPAAPPVRQFANQLQKDIEDATVEVKKYWMVILVYG